MLCRHISTQKDIAAKIDNYLELMGSEVFGPEDAKAMGTLSDLLDKQTRIVASLSGHLRLTPKSRGEYKKKDQSNAPGTEGHRRPWSEAA
jgi:hypothetical protein